MRQFEQLGIWQRNIVSGPHQEQCEKLRSSYRQFWDNAVELSREIQRDLPQLTLHDERHFEALWARADQIAGERFELTPLEVFVFGGAILLHDAANSVAAFPDRLASIEATPEWRDALAQWGEQQDDLGKIGPDEEARRNLLLDTLRGIHAERARHLADFEVKTAGRRHYLLSDDQLRTHLGALIGEIAASHHWDITTLAQRLGNTRGSLAGMPSSWTIRPILLAGLLRCADAAQLDQDRAPDFLYGLLQLRGLSETHWRAQNRLAHPFADPADPEALVFTSTRPFTADEADAWWIVFDAMGVANRELRSTDALLRDFNLPPFQVNRIRGADAPERLAQTVHVTGWRPVSAQVKISQVNRIVELFGGKKLYGQQMWVPIRELIQNAADAIRFRRELEPKQSSFEGRITVRLRDDGSDTVYIEVEDDGLGMSEAVLTGPLIDFGSSYVSSSLVKSERPGLLSKGRKRSGKFGIGFFSTFMIAKEVSVLSRPFDEGIDKTRVLKFFDNAQMRPILLDAKGEASANVSTRVSLTVSRNNLEKVLRYGSSSSSERSQITFTELVGTICPMLDADVFVDVKGELNQIHSRNWFEGDRADWLRRISLPNTNNAVNVTSETIDAQIIEAAERLTFIDPNDPSAGLAAVAGNAARGIRTIGMLKATEGFNQFSNDYWGAIDYQADDPQRTFGSPRSKALLAEWATKQAVKAAGSQAADNQIIIARRVAEFGGDATPIACIRFDREWKSLEEAFDKACREGKVYIPLKPNSGHDNGISMAVVRERQSGFLDNYAENELEFLVPIMEGSDSNGKAYYAIPTTDRPAPNSFLAMLNKLAIERGTAISGEFIARFPTARYVGVDSPRQGLFNGQTIHCDVLKLTFDTSP